MRSPTEILELIKTVAAGCDKVRAVILNGSRACASAPKDAFQDFDIIYLVNDIQYFIDHHDWVDRFGERIIMEMPAYKDFDPKDYNGAFNYQMLFTDGNRIDLTFAALERTDDMVRNDPVGIVLLDKDGLLKDKKFLSDEYFRVRPPEKKRFEDSCNSFWWVVQNVGKGLDREELPYAMHMFGYAREDLDKMVAWHIGLQHDFKVIPGKLGKYFQKFLSDEYWMRYRQTFPHLDKDEIWEALFAACGLFRELAIGIAGQYLYEYPHQDDKGMTDHLKTLHGFTKPDVSEISPDY